MFKQSLLKYKINAVLRQQTWKKYIGISKGQTKCLCCEDNLITMFDFEVAHVVAKAQGGNNYITNLRPCCSYCNRTMGIQNFFVFKSKLLNKIYTNEEHLNEIQKLIIEYYNFEMHKMTANKYINNFYEWSDIIAKTMKIEIITNKNYYKNNIKCICGFECSYITTKTTDFTLTCLNSKQNIIDVICDHLPCLINNKTFIEKTLKLSRFKEWILEKKPLSMKYIK